jgi:hypothetical protein
VPALINVLVGANCDPYFSTEAQIISDAQAAAIAITNDQINATPCQWLAYFAPLAIVGSFTPSPTPPEQDQGYWRIFGVWIHNYRLRTFAIESNDCWESTTKGGSRYYAGFRPVIVSSTPNTPYCFWDDGQQSFTPDGSSTIPGPFGDEFIRTGSGSVTWISVSEDGGPPTTYTSGEPFMPIPPIPDGYPAPPAPPPLILTGQAVIDALDPEQCATIVTEGGGFRTITDIANEYQTEDTPARDDYHNRTDAPYQIDETFLQGLLQTVPTSFWATLDLGQSGGTATVTLQAMIDAYDAADDATKKVWLEDNTNDWVLFDLLNAFTLADTEQTLKDQLLIILQRMLSNPNVFTPVVEITVQSPVSGVTFSIDTEGRLVMHIKIGKDIVGEQNQVVDLVGRYCDGDTTVPTVVSTAVNGVGATVTDEPWKRLVLDILYQLRECCNPCPEPTSETAYDENFWGEQTSNGSPPKVMSMNVPDIFRVTFQVIDNLFPKTFYYGTPPLQLLAKFAWLDSEGRFLPIQYVNLDHATFTAPNNSIIGYMCHCYTGVTLHAQVDRKFGPSNPPINAP